MEVTEHTIDEIRRLRTCINDLVSVLALPAIWGGHEPSQIGRTLLDALVSMLRLDFVYLRLLDFIGGAPIEMVQVAQRRNLNARPEEIGRLLNPCLTGQPPTSSFLIPNPVGEGKVSIAQRCLGLQDEMGVLVAGSTRADFPTETERLLLDVAANQAVIGLQEARRLNEQRRVAQELDRRVAERTRELIEREARIRRLVDANIIGIFIWELGGRILEANDAFLRIIGYDRDDLVSGRLRSTDLTPPEWLDRDTRQLLPEMKKTGSLQPFEREYFRKDGSRVPVLIGIATFEESTNQGVAFVLDLTERKRAENALRRSEAYLAEAQRLTQTGSWAWEMKTLKVLYCSEEMYRIFGFDPQDGVPTAEDFEQRMHPEDHDNVHAIAWKAISQKADYVVEHRIVRPDGTVKYIRTTGHPVLNGTGEVVEYFGTSADVTERKRAEEALRRNEAYLAEAQRLAHTGSWAWSPVTRETPYWSEEMFRIFGLDSQHGPPTTEGFWERVHPEDRDGTLELMRNAAREKREYEHDHRIVLPDGTVKHIHAIGHPILNRAGDVVEFVGTAVDVTERKRAEKALRRSEAYLAEAQRLAKTGSWAYNPATEKAIYWSEEMLRIFGLDPQRSNPPDREEFLRLMHPEDRDRFNERVEKAFREKGDFVQDYRIVLPDGTVKHLHEIGHPVLDEAGNIIEYVGTDVDVTERKRAEEERERLRQLETDLAHMNRVSMMGELAASLAHEIKQPIAAAVTNANTSLRWLARDEPDLEEAREAITRIVKDGTRAAEIINRLRSFYEKGAPPQPELVDLHELVREMLMLLRNEANRYSIAMRTELAPELPKVMADRVQLQQVFMNLMLNGIEAMKETAGELTIKSHFVNDGQLLISVSDTGVGLPADKADQIFNAFFTTKPQGTGMGLAITRSIIEAHGGRLWASANTGRGATFHFTLPSEATASSTSAG